MVKDAGESALSCHAQIARTTVIGVRHRDACEYKKTDQRLGFYNCVSGSRINSKLDRTVLPPLYRMVIIFVTSLG